MGWSVTPVARQAGRVSARPSPPQVPDISPAEAGTVIGAGGILLDVREPDEWEAGHAPAATWIPMGQLAERLSELPTDRRIVAVCRSGMRSAQVTAALLDRGYDAVNLAGGMQAWHASALPVITDSGVPGRVA